MTLIDMRADKIRQLVFFYVGHYVTDEILGEVSAGTYNDVTMYSDNFMIFFAHDHIRNYIYEQLCEAQINDHKRGHI
jgi:hypothetical protein